MAVTKIYTANGQIAGQRVGDDFTRYMPDALGSVTTTSTNGSLATATYTPLGGGASPNNIPFGWLGALGYRQTAGPSALQHVRRRHMPPQHSLWLSRDIYWPGERPFTYVSGNPVSRTDATGATTLGTTTSTGPTAESNCGAACVTAGWTVSDDKFDGYIVQHITNLVDGYTCPGDGPYVALQPLCPEYWEIWRVKGINIYNHGNSNSSVDAWSLIDYGHCSFGTSTKIGVGKLVPFSQVNENEYYPSSDKRGSPCSGTSNSRTSTPTGGWSDSGGYRRTFTSTWGCCCNGNTNLDCGFGDNMKEVVYYSRESAFTACNHTKWP